MYSCESFLDYAYEGEVKSPLVVRIQNTITKIIEMIKKFTLMVRSIKKEHVVPKKALDAYRSLSKMCFNCINKCKSSLQSGSPVKVIFNEPFDSPEYKTLFNEDIKKKTPPGEYVKIGSNEVLGFMNGALTALSNAKQALRVVKADTQPNQAQAFTQIINYAKFMLKISNRVLSYKNMYVEPRHLPTTKVDDSNAVNEAYQTCIEEIDIAMEGIFSNVFNKKPIKKDVPIVEKKDIRDYPDINSAFSKIIHYIHAELYKFMSRSGDTQWSVENSGIWYANDHFCQCAFVQGYAGDANFTKIIANTKTKFSSLIKKYRIKIEKDEYQYCDAIFINAYI